VAMTAASARFAVVALAVLAVLLMLVAVRVEAYQLTAARVIRGFAGVCAVLAAAVAVIPER
jgi:hypothetical protein